MLRHLAFASAIAVGLAAATARAAEPTVAALAAPTGAGTLAEPWLYATQPIAPGASLAVGAWGSAQPEALGGLWARWTLARDVGRARLAMGAIGSRRSGPGHDALDVVLLASASYPLAPRLRIGADWIARDLEAWWDPLEVDGGARQLVASTMSLDVAPRVHVAAGPAVEMPAAIGGRANAALLGRLTVACEF